MKSLKLVLSISLMITASSFLLISGCLDEKEDNILDLIVVSIGPQKQMVKSIVGEDVNVVVMVPENMDPHTYSPTPSQLLKVSRADIYFKVGSGVEFEETNMDTLKETGSHMKVVDLSEGIDVVSFEDHQGSQENTDTHDDDHHGTDPHIWLDPKNMKKMADNVLKALEAEDPDNAGSFRSNHEAYITELDDLLSDIEEDLEPFSNMKFLTYHPAWGYFADAFDLIQLSVEEDGKEPGPQGVASLIDQAREENITVVFVEPQFDTSSASQIANAIGGKVVTVDPLSSDYMENLRIVADKMREGFGGSIE